jgi:hypothetical protein
MSGQVSLEATYFNIPAITSSDSNKGEQEQFPNLANTHQRTLSVREESRSYYNFGTNPNRLSYFTGTPKPELLAQNFETGGRAIVEFNSNSFQIYGKRISVKEPARPIKTMFYELDKTTEEELRQNPNYFNEKNYCDILKRPLGDQYFILHDKTIYLVTFDTPGVDAGGDCLTNLSYSPIIGDIPPFQGYPV